MRALVFTDLHIKESELVECNNILDEILDKANKLEASVIINLGDTFDTVSPSSNSLDLYARFCVKWGRELIMISALSHESTNEETSVLNHYGILSPHVHIYPVEYNINGILLGHYMLQESQYSFGENRKASDYGKYKLVLLGHQHSYQKVKGNIIHVGSSRYCTFSEYKDPHKKCLLIDLELGTVIEELILDSAVPMAVIQVTGKEFHSAIEELRFLHEATRTDKVKLILQDEDAFKQFLVVYPKLKPLFRTLTYKIGYKKETPSKPETRVISLKETFSAWLEKQDLDPDVNAAINGAISLCD